MSQIVGQVRVRVQNRMRDPAKILASVDASGWQVASTPTDLNLPDPVPAQSPEDLASGTFSFIGQQAHFDDSIDWSAKGLPRLWQYNLQYFDWLWSLLEAKRKLEGGEQGEDCRDWEAARRYVLDWVDRHPPVKGACGWEPYPTSLRLMNWTLLFGVRHRQRFVEDRELHDAVMESIAKQVRWLELNLETHIQANHLLENIAALACVGSVFDGEATARTLGRVMPLLERELAEQILPDGLHYERSAMYHLRMLWLVEMLEATMSPVEVDRLNLSGIGGRMKGALACLRHPDGNIAQFNDAVIGVYHDGWRGDASTGAWALPDAGYYGFRNTSGDYIAIDAGAIGPDYQPGHAHADYLSFELSLDGQRIITDTGVGTYDSGSLRSFDRSTAAHSTVEVCGENSCEVWGGFRVGRRVTPVVNEWTVAGDRMVLDTEHSGYAHLSCSAVHRRRIEWSDGTLTLDDTVRLGSSVDVVSRVHFAPGVQVVLNGRSAVVYRGEFTYEMSWDLDCEVSLGKQNAHPTFGAALERQVLVMRMTGISPEVRCRVQVRKIEQN